MERVVADLAGRRAGAEAITISRLRAAPDSAARATTTWQGKHVLMVVAVGALLGTLRAELSIESDAFWQARYGITFLTTWHLPRADVYSWTASRAHWIPSSWLWNVVLGAAYDLAGVIGIRLLGIAVAMSIALVVTSVARRLGAPPVPTALVFAVFGLAILAASPRAETVSNIFILVLPALLPGLLNASNSKFATRLLAVAVIQWLWMNLHTVALIGPAVLAVAGAGLIAEQRFRGRRRVASARLAGAVALSAACCLLTPYGIEPLTHAAEVRDASVGLINEWDHIGFGSPAQVISLITVVASCGLAWRAIRGGRLGSAAVLIMLAGATASAIRFTSFELLTATPEIAYLIGGRRIRPRAIRSGLAVVVAIFGTLTVSQLGRFSHYDDATSSANLVAELPAHCVLVNDYGLGGTVLLLRPDVKVSIDGRNDMYGRARVLAAAGMLGNRPGTMERIDSAGVNCVLVPTDAPLVAALQHVPGWQVAGHDTARTLLLRVAVGPAADR